MRLIYFLLTFYVCTLFKSNPALAVDSLCDTTEVGIKINQLSTILNNASNSKDYTAWTSFDVEKERHQIIEFFVKEAESMDIATRNIFYRAVFANEIYKLSLEDSELIRKEWNLLVKSRYQLNSFISAFTVLEIGIEKYVNLGHFAGESPSTLSSSDRAKAESLKIRVTPGSLLRSSPLVAEVVSLVQVYVGLTAESRFRFMEKNFSAFPELRFSLDYEKAPTYFTSSLINNLSPRHIELNVINALLSDQFKSSVRGNESWELKRPNEDERAKITSQINVIQDPSRKLTGPEIGKLLNLVVPFTGMTRKARNQMIKEVSGNPKELDTFSKIDHQNPIDWMSAYLNHLNSKGKIVTFLEYLSKV